jgi:hypothetical protein
MNRLVLSFAKRLLCALLPAAAAVAALAASTQIAADKPIINFSLPTLTPEGNRSWLVRGSEAIVVSQDQIDIKELTLSLFSGQPDGKVETMILSPKARVQPAESVVTGENTIRVINDEYEATGSEWRYAHKEKRVTIAHHVRVAFNAELKEFLK